MLGQTEASGALHPSFTRDQWIDHLQRLAQAEQQASPIPELKDTPPAPDYLMEVRAVVRSLSN
ncbi:hypothetical protein H4CHR_01747 [Variovorax sp. PBS-H4]|uniref:hypothetical protein n=1 Tax=Variovorax sp. PBS-H4 TaxID=434008 RepID=UPI00131931F8|nr:hypothetical protein [Variovorax sp. PBS-H4]VTU26195.1 hypothetical protein H4CHR_01747 [Variovorax sp. PBS-H4]